MTSLRNDSRRSSRGGASLSEDLRFDRAARSGCGGTSLSERFKLDQTARGERGGASLSEGLKLDQTARNGCGGASLSEGLRLGRAARSGPRKDDAPSHHDDAPSHPETAPSRIALVCDWLTTPGGAEKVLLELHRLYPDAPIYTSQYRPKKLDWFKDATVKTGWLNLFPAAFRKILGPLRQLYFSHLDLSHYDLVISVTGAEAKAVRTTPRPYRSRSSRHYDVALPPQPHAVHLCYCHVPTQYYWQLYDRYLAHPGFGPLDPLARLFLKLFIGPLRKADLRAAARPDQFITISHYAADQIQTYYHRDSLIIPPPVDTQTFSTANSTALSTKSPDLSTDSADLSTKPSDFSTTFPQGFPQNFFVIACRQVAWKRVDLAISACLAAGQPLCVIGDGPEHAALTQLAAGSDLIHFVPWLSSADLAAYLHRARAFLFPSLEPFGIAAVEALAAGCPVIAYAAGGSRDFVTPGQNGLLFSEQTPESLRAALDEFAKLHLNPAVIAKSAAPFDQARFRQGITNLVEEYL